MDLGIVPSTSQDIYEEEMWIYAETCPPFRSLFLRVEPSHTISRLISEMEDLFRIGNPITNIDDCPLDSLENFLWIGNTITNIDHCPLDSLEKSTMLIFKGKNLLDHPDSSLQELGIRHRDKITIFDKSPFLIKISMCQRKNSDIVVEVEAHDTVYSLKQKIETVLGIPVDSQNLCYVDKACPPHHWALADDSAPLSAYDIVKHWKNVEPRIWLYTNNNLSLEGINMSPTKTVASRFYEMEIFVKIYRQNGDQFLCVLIQPDYTVNLLIKMIRQVKSCKETSIGMLLYRGKNLLEHGTTRLWEFGIQDQDMLLIPEEGPFAIFVFLSSSSIRQQQKIIVEVEANWSVLTLKEIIMTRTNISIEKQRLCYLQKGSADEECHLVLTNNSRSLVSYGIMKHGQYIGLFNEDACQMENNIRDYSDRPTREEG